MKSKEITFGTFVVWFPESDSISSGVVEHIKNTTGCVVAARRHELWADSLNCSLETLINIINSDKRIYRRKDRKICLRKAS
jgi:hypothetical protein